jgi:pimeloyl-ACP methyl ester carboxylesterase
MVNCSNNDRMDRVQFHEMTLPGETSPNALLTVPGEQKPTALVVSVHGISRNVREHAATVGQAAMRRGWATLTPIFDRDRYLRYQQLGGKNGQGRSDLALDAIVDIAFERIGLNSAPFFLAGFSGGAQFSHRYALLYPHRVRALALASAGWYTNLDSTRSFPRGIKPVKRLEMRFANLDAFLRIPLHVCVGELDKIRDPALRTSQYLDKVQGKNRVDRAETWLHHVEAVSDSYRIKTPRQFELLPDTDHDFTNATDPDKGALAEKWISFFAASAACELIENRKLG